MVLEPDKVVKVNSLYRYDKAEIPFTKFASPCLDEFDKFMAKQEDLMLILVDN